MKKIDLQFRKNGIQEFIDLFNSLLEQCDFNLNQYVKGTSLAIPSETSEEFLEKLKEFVNRVPEVAKQIDNREIFWDNFKQLEDYNKNEKFIKWVIKYMDAVIRPFEEASFLKELDDDDFNDMAKYCFDNLVIQDIGKNNLDEKWNKKDCMTLKKIMFTYIEMVVWDNLSKENAFCNMESMFGIKENYCNVLWEYIQHNEARLWRLMLIKQYKRMENKVDSLIEMIEE